MNEVRASIPPRNGEGDRAKRGGGGSTRAVKAGGVLARRLRREMSLPERVLWAQLRGQQLGVKFRKGHPIGPYVIDFYCCEIRLAVEVDGEAHGRGEAPGFDERRDAFLRENGHHVLRFTANDVLRNLEGTLAAISAHVMSPLHRKSGPPPRSGEE